MARCRSACVARFGRAQHRDRAGDHQGHAGGRSNRRKGTWWCPTLWPAFAVQPVLGGCISHSQRHRIGSTSREEPSAPGAIPTGEIREHTGLSRNIDTIGPSLKTGPGSPIRCGQCLNTGEGPNRPERRTSGFRSAWAAPPIKQSGGSWLCTFRGGFSRDLAKPSWAEQLATSI